MRQRKRGRERKRERELSWNSGAICHFGMALELHGGPPLSHGRRIFSSLSGEARRSLALQREGVRGRGLTRAQPVRPLAGQTGGWEFGWRGGELI